MQIFAQKMYVFLKKFANMAFFLYLCDGLLYALQYLWQNDLQKPALSRVTSS